MYYSQINKMSLWLILLFLVPNISFSQETKEEEKVYKSVEEPPEFPGGRDSLKAFLNRHLKYPYDDKMAGREGEVLITFVVEKDGTFSNVKIEPASEPAPSREMVEEARRVFKLMPTWTPGKQRGKTVRVAHKLPVSFAFYGSRKQKKTKKEKVG